MKRTKDLLSDKEHSALSRRLYSAIGLLMFLGVPIITTSCGDKPIENQYLGKLPYIHYEYCNTSNANKKNRLDGKYNAEFNRLKGSTIPCIIPDGIPLKVLDSLHIVDKNYHDIKFEGSLVFTKDMPVAPQTISYITYPYYREHAELQIVSYITYDRDRVYNPLYNMEIHKSLIGDKSDYTYIDGVFTKWPHVTRYWSNRERWSPVVDYSSKKSEDIVCSNPDNIFEGINFWDKGDTLNIKGSIYLYADSVEKIVRFTGVKIGYYINDSIKNSYK